MGTLKRPGYLFIFFLDHEVHLSLNGIYGDCELFYVFQTGQNHCWPSYQNLAETIEKPSMSMVNQRKNIKWWWSSGSKTINSNGTLKKNHYHPIVVKKWPLLKSISPPQVNCPPQGRSAVGRALVAWQDPDTSSKLSSLCRGIQLFALFENFKSLSWAVKLFDWFKKFRRFLHISIHFFEAPWPMRAPVQEPRWSLSNPGKPFISAMEDTL